MMFVCIYLRIKQYLNMIWGKLAVLSLNTVQTLRIPGSQQQIWRKIQKIGQVLSPGSPAFWMYASGLLKG